MTFTSTLLAVLAGIAIWQLIIFFVYACGMEDNDFFCSLHYLFLFNTTYYTATTNQKINYVYFW